MHPVEDVTFIDKFQIEVIGRHTITITVYEKSMAGCVSYMDQYIYFDNDAACLKRLPKSWRMFRVFRD